MAEVRATLEMRPPICYSYERADGTRRRELTQDMAKQAVRKKTTPSVDRAADAPSPSRRRTSKSPSPAQPSPTCEPSPSREEVATRAYFRFIERGGVPGHDLEDWFLAEADLKSGSDASA
jgi:hypothetical protein